MKSKIPQIRGVRVNSGIFSDGFDVNLFNGGDKRSRVSIIFGHNGSDKSTLAREIDAIKSGNGEGFFYDYSNQMLDLGDVDRARIRVFGEEYIESKIRINKDGLEAFAMLGEQIDAADEIERIDEKISDIRTDNEKLMLEIDELSGDKGSIYSLEQEAKDAVKNGGWESRVEQVEGTTPKLTQRRWNEILKASTDLSRGELEKQFNGMLSEYRRASDAGSGHLPKLSQVAAANYDEINLLNLLAKRVENPTLSDREKRILELVQSGRQCLVEEATRVFSQPETEMCPMCQRDISQQEKDSIVDSVCRVLNKEVDAFKEELSGAALQEIPHQETAEQITDRLRADLLQAEHRVNELVQKYNDLIAERMANIYSPIPIEPLGLSEALRDLNGIVERVNGDITTLISC